MNDFDDLGKLMMEMNVVVEVGGMDLDKVEDINFLNLL